MARSDKRLIQPPPARGANPLPHENTNRNHILRVPWPRACHRPACVASSPQADRIYQLTLI